MLKTRVNFGEILRRNIKERLINVRTNEEI